MSERRTQGLGELHELVEKRKIAEPNFADGWDDIERFARFLASEGRLPADAVSLEHDLKARIIKHPKFDFDVDGHSVVIEGQRTALRPKLFGLLNYLIRRPNMAVSRREILHNIWDEYTDTRAVDVHVGKLRDILANGREENLNIIKTVWGVGYMLYDESKDPAVGGKL